MNFGAGQAKQAVEDDGVQRRTKLDKSFRWLVEHAPFVIGRNDEHAHIELSC